MPGYQKITVVGHLGRDPELRYLPNGNAVCNFSIGVSEKNNGVKHTTWFKVSLWGKRAEAANQYLTKGVPVLVTGRLRSGDDGNPATFTKRDGTMGTSFEINADDFSFMGSKDDSVVNSGNAPAQPVEDDYDSPF